jgi:hypothetical protein
LVTSIAGAADPNSSMRRALYGPDVGGSQGRWGLRIRPCSTSPTELNSSPPIVAAPRSTERISKPPDRSAATISSHGTKCWCWGWPHCHQ